MRYFETSEVLQTGHKLTAADADDGSWPQLAPLPTTRQACCCSARPRVTVLLPPAAPGGQPVDLLLCGHHFRSSRSSLDSSGALAFDARGRLIPLIAEAT
jgi:hypothetical protein